MAKPLNILFVSSEVEPFAKTGGLGEVSRALPQMVREMKHEIRIMMPRYGFISDRRFLLHDVLRLREIPIPTAYDTKIGSVNSSFVNSIKTKVQVYFLANKEYFGSRQGLYVNPKSNKEYVDNDERFIFFCRGVLETLKLLGWQPDIIHCNDWQTGLIPVYLKTLYKDDEFFKNIKTVFTIHNLAYQGIFPQASFLKTGLPQEVFGINGVEFYGKMNCMKAGLLYSDIITTVSEKYAKEICSSEDYGCGLEGILHKRKSNLYGILNGIDEELWNPETDKFITQRYDSDSIEGKQENKRELLSKFGLEYQEGVPLIGMVSRLVDQKGIDLIKEISDKFMKMDIQLIVLGTGEERYQDFFAKLRKKYPKKEIQGLPGVPHRQLQGALRGLAGRGRVREQRRRGAPDGEGSHKRIVAWAEDRDGSTRRSVGIRAG